MATQHVPTLGRPPRAAPKHLGAALAGVALALLVAVGAIVWQATRDDEEVAPVAPNVAAVPAAPAGTTAVPRPTLFVVAADEEAGLLAARLEALGSNASVQIERIQVVATDDEFAELQQFVTEMNRLRDAEELAPVALVDLRPAPPPAPPAVGAPVVSGPEGAGSHPEWYPTSPPVAPGSAAPPAADQPAFMP